MATSNGPTGGLLMQFVISTQVLRIGIPMADIAPIHPFTKSPATVPETTLKSV